ncbi:MAG: DMT family transporter [Nitrospirota bacterium]
MVFSHSDSSRDSTSLVYLLSAMLMLSTVSPVTKDVLKEGTIPPFELVCLRLLIAFLFLFLIALTGPRQELFGLTWKDVFRLTLLGLLGVGVAYGCAAWALLYTSVTHYALIYSLNPSLTALFSFLMRKERLSLAKVSGILLSLAGCLLSIPEGFQDRGVGFGDALVFVFTVSASASIVLSSGIVRRYGAPIATTVMFGSSTFILLFGGLVWSVPYNLHLTVKDGFWILYIGLATAGVFVLRHLSLRALSPVTVGAFHNLVPIFGVVLAYLFLDEPVTAQMVLGGATILTGVELVRRG